MRVKNSIVSGFFLLIASLSYAQVASKCSTLGQTPATAFPICATDVFSQSTVPVCTNFPVTVPGCGASTSAYADKNPFWYRFTCYQAGTLSFLITPNNLGDDYDWQLYDVTGITDLSAVYSNTNLFVVGNWSGSYGLTGASATGKNVVECGSDPADNINKFSPMPVLQEGHTYLLLVSHFSDSQSGYKLSFAGGTAVITDNKLPDLQSIKPSCDAGTITIKLNKKIKCGSLAADGSDFTVTPALASVVSATGGNCNSSFDMDSVIVTLSNPLPAGNYTFSIKKGTDANTLLDNCDRGIAEGQNLPFIIVRPQPTPLDSVTPVKCAPSQLALVFKKNILCSSIAPNGSDFVVTGPSPVTVIAASGNCDNSTNPQSSTIILKLASPITKGGVYQVKLLQGLDGNPIIDECGQTTPAGSTINFIAYDTVSADFNDKVFLGCRSDTITLSHDGANGVNKWSWAFDVFGTSNAQATSVSFKVFGDKKITLKVSNGVCADSTTRTIALPNKLKAAFETTDLLCPEDAAVFKNTSIGDITGYNWDFGNGNTSILPSPAPLNYAKTGAEKIYHVKLVVQNNANCFDTATTTIKVLKTCYIAVPSAFTPNGDGLNDYLYPLNAYKADNLDFSVYNRLGQMVFHSAILNQKWDGMVSGRPQNAGVYVWILRYTNHDTGLRVFQKGTSVLIR